MCSEAEIVDKSKQLSEILLPDTVMRKATESVLLHSVASDSVGFSHGRMGMAVTLFELGRYLNYEPAEENACTLTEEILTYNIEGCNFRSGKAGIAVALQYLIETGLLDADYMELYGCRQQEIISHIYSLTFNKSELFDYPDYWFFTETSSYISQTDRQKCEKALSDCFSAAIDIYGKLRQKNTASFYSWATTLLTVLNSHRHSSQSDSLYARISAIHEKLRAMDYICTEPEFFAQSYLYELLLNKEQPAGDAAEFLNNSVVNSHIPEILTLRQRVNLIISMLRISQFGVIPEIDAAIMLLAETLCSDDADLFEQKFFKAVNQEYDLSLDSGLCRLLLMFIYWNDLRHGTPSLNFVKLMI
jgi:hypothetical protein